MSSTSELLSPRAAPGTDFSQSHGTLSDEDVAAMNKLAESLLHPVPTTNERSSAFQRQSDISRITNAAVRPSSSSPGLSARNLDSSNDSPSTITEKPQSNQASSSNGGDQHLGSPAGRKQSGGTSRTDSGTASRQPSGETAKKSKLPPWLTKGLKSKRIWKTLFRVAVCLLVNFVFLMDQKTLNVMGQSGFFCLIVDILLPPIMPAPVYFMALMTLVFGMLLGWAWGAAAMAAALRARSKTVLAAAYQKANASLVPGVNPQFQFQTFIFEGMFLDYRSTVVIGFFFFIGAYFFGLVRAKAPMLMIFAIFGTIVLDVFMSYGIYFPTGNYTLPKAFLIPTAMYAAVALVTTCLIFPESLHHSVCHTYVDDFLRPALAVLRLQTKVLHNDADDVEVWREEAQEARQLCRQTGATLGGLDGQLGLLGLEPSRGRLGPTDLAQHIGKSRNLSGRLLGLSSFQLLVLRFLSNEDHPTAPHFRRFRQLAHEREALRGTSLKDLLPLLEATSANLRDAADSALSAYIDAFEMINTTRWKKSAAIDLIPKLDRLRKAVNEFRTQHHKDLLEPFVHMKDAPQRERRLAARWLYLCFVFSTNLTSFSTALIDHIEHFSDSVKPTNRIFFPAALAKVGKVMFSKKQRPRNPLEISDDANENLDNDDAHSSENDEDDEDEKTLVNQSIKQKEPRWRRSPDAGIPRNGLQKSIRLLGAVWSFVTSDEGLFALKYAIVSICLWLPAVFPNSAFFNYRERGLWALIMAQMGLGVYAGELIIGAITRIAGTVIGALLGAVCWYIGSGTGNGEPYGITAISIVVLLPIIYLRMVAPPQYLGAIMIVGVTLALVVGYSWVDTHLVLLANSGKGIEVAWRRGLLVLIGFAAAFIISLFPKPVTAKVVVRKTLAKAIHNLSDIYALEMKAFLTERHKDSPVPREVSMRGNIVKLIVRMNGLRPQMANATMEPSLAGPWPKEEYERLVELLYNTTGALTLLSGAWAEMSRGCMNAFVDATPFFDPSLVTDVLGEFTAMSNALNRGMPLPPALPLREKLAIKAGRDLDYAIETKDLVNEQVGVYATAFVAALTVFGYIDELRSTVADLAGENTYGLGDWLRDEGERGAKLLV